MLEFQIQASVDRIVEGWAVLLLEASGGEVQVDWPVALLPKGIREGSKLDFAIGENKQAEIDARQRVVDLLSRLTGKEEDKSR